MAKKDRNDNFLEITSRVSEVNRCIEGLERKIIELGRKKKDLEDMRRGLDEISIRFYHIDHSDSQKKEEDDLKKKLNELISEFDKLKEGIVLDDDDLGGADDEKKVKKLDDSEEEIHESKKIKLEM